MSEERNRLEIIVWISSGIEALTFALYINSGDLIVNSIWALPIMTMVCVMALFALERRSRSAQNEN